MLLCVIVHHKRVRPGKRFGYTLEAEVIEPFVLRDDACVYGYAGHIAFPIDIRRKAIEPGTYFTLGPDPRSANAQYTCRITSVRVIGIEHEEK